MKKLTIIAALGLFSVMLTGCHLHYTQDKVTCADGMYCEKCGVLMYDPQPHTLSNPTILQEATCSAPGSQEGDCEVCGAFVTVEIPQLEHIPGEPVITKEATANEPGEMSRYCTVCGEFVDFDYYEAGEEPEVVLTPAEIEQAYKETCEEYTYEDICRYPDNYKDKAAVFTGKVIQAVESRGKWTLRVEVTQGTYTWDDVVYVTYTSQDGDPRILEDDIITMWGDLAGMKSYTAVLGNKITIPYLKAKYIELHIEEE